MSRRPPCHDDTTRFETSFAANYPDVARYCARRSPDPGEAEDAVTETFAVAWRRRSDLPVAPEDRMWLFGIARRVVANQRRGHERRRRLLDRLRVSDAGSPAPAPSDEASGLRAALDRLSPGHRELLLLVAWEGLSVREIAAVLGVPAPVVSRRLHRARTRLAVLLDTAGDAGHVASETPGNLMKELS